MRKCNEMRCAGSTGRDVRSENPAEYDRQLNIWISHDGSRDDIYPCKSDRATFKSAKGKGDGLVRTRR